MRSGFLRAQSCCGEEGMELGEMGETEKRHGEVDWMAGASSAAGPSKLTTSLRDVNHTEAASGCGLRDGNGTMCRATASCNAPLTVSARAWIY